LDLETEVELTLEEVATGVERTLEFQRMDLCETCGGSGAKPGTVPKKCSTCGGYGQVQQQVSGFFGLSVRVVACPDCRGRGSIVQDKCSGCRGTGRVRQKRTLNIKIPAGIRDGQVVRVRGEGEPARSNTVRGDLHVYVSIKQHPLLVRQGDDLLCQVPVPFAAAAIGGTVAIPTLSGQEELDIPPGTQNGQVITLRKKGLPQIHGTRRGDQHVQIYIEVPQKLTQQQRQLLEAYAKTENDNIAPKRKSFLDALKEHFSDNRKKR
jgi:molecular chaperone DnaJ